MGQHLAARRFKAQDMNYKAIAKKIRSTEREVRAAFSDVIRKPKRRHRALIPKVAPGDRNPGNTYFPSPRLMAGIEEPKKLNIPHDVLADRERRLSTPPRSLTAALLGDPLPGRSALDKRGY
jgi:hypothetical protein